MTTRKRLRELRKSSIPRSRILFGMISDSTISNSGGANMNDSTRGSNGSGRLGPVEAVQDMRRRLALVQHNRRHAIFEARDAHGDRPTPAIPRPPRLPTFPPARDKLPTLDDLTDSDAPKARAARWKLVLALAAALGGL